MELKELISKEEMLQNFDLIREMYPSITLEEYSNELDIMLPHNYGQVAIYDGTTCAGLTGYWVGSKLWCGKYMELDNVVVSSEYRSQGIGDRLFKHMEQKAKDLDCTMLSLDSNTATSNAHNLFYEQNFVPRVLQHYTILDQ